MNSVRNFSAFGRLCCPVHVQEIKEGEFVKVIEPVFECDGGQRCAVLCKLEGRDAKGWAWLKDKGGKLKLEESREHKLEPQRSEEAVPPEPLKRRTFAISNFRRVYSEVKAPQGPLELGAMLHQLIEWYCRKNNISFREEGYPFLQDLEKEAMKGENAQELVKEIYVAAQRLWTSAKQLCGREFCFILNAAVQLQSSLGRSTSFASPYRPAPVPPTRQTMFASAVVASTTSTAASTKRIKYFVSRRSSRHRSQRPWRTASSNACRRSSTRSSG